MLATSSGLTAFAPLPKSKPEFNPSDDDSESLFKGTPSITYKGWLLPLNELTPRIITEFEAPGSDEVAEI